MSSTAPFSSGVSPVSLVTSVPPRSSATTLIPVPEPMPESASRRPLQRRGHGDREQLHAFAEHDQLVAAQQRHDRLDAERRVAEDEVRAGAVNRFDVALVRDAADDAQRRVQPAAVHRQVDVHRVVVGREQDGRHPMDAGLLEEAAVGRVAGKQRDAVFTHRFERRARCDRWRGPRPPSASSARAAAWPTFPAPMISTGGGGLAIARHQRVERGDLRFGAGEHDDAVRLDDGIGKRRPQLAALPEADHADAGLFPKPGVADRLAGEDRVARREAPRSAARDRRR